MQNYLRSPLIPIRNAKLVAADIPRSTVMNTETGNSGRAGGRGRRANEREREREREKGREEQGGK